MTAYDTCYRAFFDTPGASWESLFAALDAAAVPVDTTLAGKPLPSLWWLDASERMDARRARVPETKAA